MAGGKGTRLRPFTNVIPKPLVPIGDLSIIELILKQLKYFGFEEIIISVGYKAEIIMAVIGNGSKFGLKIRYFVEDKPLGTLGSLNEISNLDDNFIVMNGDICTNLNFKKIFINHLNNETMATVGVYKRFEKIELGVIKLDDIEKRIIKFEEKPEYEFFISMGINVFSKSILNHIPKGSFFGFDDLMNSLIKNNEKICPYIFNGEWLDIGRPDDYNKMLEIYEKNPNLIFRKALK